MQLVFVQSLLLIGAKIATLKKKHMQTHTKTHRQTYSQLQLHIRQIENGIDIETEPDTERYS